MLEKAVPIFSSFYYEVWKITEKLDVEDTTTHVCSNQPLKLPCWVVWICFYTKFGQIWTQTLRSDFQWKLWISSISSYLAQIWNKIRRWNRYTGYINEFLDLFNFVYLGATKYRQNLPNTSCCSINFNWIGTEVHKLFPKKYTKIRSSSNFIYFFAY